MSLSLSPSSLGRRLLQSALASLLLFGVMDAWMRSPFGRARATAVRAAAAHAAGGELQVDGLRASLLPPGLHARGWRLRAAGAAAPFAWAGPTEVGGWPKAWRRPLALAGLEVEGLRVDGRRAWPTRTEGRHLRRWGLPVDLVCGRLRDAQIVWPLMPAAGGAPKAPPPAGKQATASRWLALRQVQLQLQPGRPGHRRLQLQVGAIDGEPADLRQCIAQLLMPTWPPATPPPRQSTAPAATHLELDAELEGDLQAPRLLRLQRLRLQAPGLLLQGTASVALHLPATADALPPLPLQAQLKGSLNLDPLAPLLHLPWALAGQLQVQARCDGDGLQPTKLRLRGEAQIAALRLRALQAGALQATFCLQGAQLTLSRLRLRQPGGGSVTGEARVDLRRADLTQKATLQLQRASLPQLLEAGGLPRAWLRAELSGEMHFAGPLRPLRQQLRANLLAEGLALLGHPYGAASTLPPLLQLPSSQMRAAGHWTAGHLQLEPSVWATAHSALSLQGTLDVRAGLRLQLRSSGVDLHELGPLGGSLRLGGTCRFTGTAVGPWQQVQTTLPLQVEGLSMQGFALGNAQGLLHHAPPQLQITRLQLRPAGAAAGPAAVHGEVRVDFSAVPLQLQAAMKVQQLQLAALAHALSPTLSLGDGLRAPLDGELALQGPLATLDGNLALHSTSLRSASVEAGQLQAAARLRRGRLDAATSLSTPQGASLLLHAEQVAADDWQVRGALQKVPLGLLNTLVEAASVRGRVAGLVDLHGPLSQLAGNLHLHGEQVGLWGVPLGGVTLGGDAQGGTLQLAGALHEPAQVDPDGPAQDPATLPLRGSLQLHGRLPFVLRAELQAFDGSFLLAQLGEIQLLLEGQAQLRGELADARALQLDLQLQRARLQISGSQLQLRQPAQLHYAGGLMNIPSLLLEGTGLRSRVGASWGPHRPLSAQLDASGDVSAFAGLLPSEWVPHGPFALHLRLAGSLPRPSVTGSAALRGVSLLYTPTQQNVTDLSTQVSFLGRSAVIQYGRARVRDGRLSFFGEALLADGPLRHALQLNLRSTLRRATWRFPFELEASASGDLQLVGRLDDLLLRGGLRLERARYTAQFDFDQLVPKKVALPLRTQVGLPTEGVRLRIHLAAPGNIFISSPVLQAELQGDLTLTGSSNRPGLLGSITPRWARARYRDNNFEVVRASIDFLEEFRIFTAFELSARTQACSINADVLIQGNSDHYSVQASGQDPRGSVDPQDVLACLQFGLRLHDFDSNQRNPASYSDALPGSLDALWTVSGLDSKVRRVLPIGVDELRLTSGWSSLSQRTTARVLVGKQLRPGLALKYSRALDEYNDQALILEYALPDPAALQANWMSARDMPIGDFGFDLRLFWELQ